MGSCRTLPPSDVLARVTRCGHSTGGPTSATPKFMAKVTQVERQKRNLQRFNIFLDGVFAFGADEDLVVNYRLVPGKTIEKPDLEKLLFEAEVGKLMEKMYRLFGIRQRSEREVRNYFRMKNAEFRIEKKEEVSELALESLIDKLKEKNMINDLEFAKAWVESRRKNKNKGRRALQAELVQKGINREIIEKVLSIKGQGSSEEELATQALKRKLKSWQNLPEPEFKKKVYEFLLRRGFDYGVVKVVVRETLVKLKRSLD